MISNTLREFIGQHVTVKVINSYSALGGTLEKVEDDHIVLVNSGKYLEKYGNGRIVINTNQIVNVITTDDERVVEGKNGSTEGRQKLVNVHK